MKKRKQYTTKQKAQIVLELLKEENPGAVCGDRPTDHPGQLAQKKSGLEPLDE